MNWQKTDKDYAPNDTFINVTFDNDSGYDVGFLDGWDHWVATYNPPNRIGGYLSNRLKIECGYGLAAAVGVKPNCRFASKEEAKAVCERHYQLLILQ